MPKQQGEIRLVGVDLASSAAKGSDNSSFVLGRLIPTRKGYKRQIVYVETHNGVGAPAQALRILLTVRRQSSEAARHLRHSQPVCGKHRRTPLTDAIQHLRIPAMRP